MSKASAAEASGQAGFSLVEMLAALALVALIASFLSSTAGSGLRAWRAAKDLDREAQFHAVRGLLRERLAAVTPLRTRDKDGNLRLEFAGTDQRLEFASMMPEGQVKAGPYKVSLYLVPEAGADALRPSWLLKMDLEAFQAKADDRPVPQVHSTVLLTGVETFSLRYFGQQSFDGDAEWTPQWTQRRLLPFLIEVNIGSVKEPINATLTAQLKLAMRR